MYIDKFEEKWYKVGLHIHTTLSDGFLTPEEVATKYKNAGFDAIANEGIVFPLIATDDAHYYDRSDDTKSFIMVNSKSGRSEDLLDAINNQKFYSSQGPELYVRREGNKIIADCSECIMIDFLSNSAISKDKAVRGENLTHAEYMIKDYEKWVRVEVHDKNGNYAWSNILAL